MNYNISPRHVRAKGLSICALLFSILLIAGCIEQPIAPSWDIEANAPLVNRQYTLLDVLNKDTLHLKYFTGGDSNNVMYYSDLRSLSPIYVDKKIKMYPTAKSTKISLNTIKTYSPAPFSTSISAGALGLTPRQNSFVPPISGLAVPATVPAISEFESIDLESGNLKITVSNYISASLTMTVSYVKLMNAQNNQEILRTAPVTLTPLQSTDINISLAGKTLVNQMKAELLVSTPGAASATIADTSSIKVRFEIQNPVPSAVTAKIPQQDPVNYSGAFTLDDSSFLKKIEIDEGQLTFNIRNYFQVALDVNFTVNNLRDGNNQPFNRAIALEKSGHTGSIKDVVINDLHNWSIVSTSGLSNELTFTVVVQARSSGASAVRISKTDSVGVTVLMSQLTLKSIEGKLKPTPLEFRRTTLPLRLGNLKGFKADSIHFRKFLLNFDIGMTSSVKIGFKGTVTGRNAARRDSIKIPYKVIGGGSISRVDLSSADLDHFINSFLDAPPDTLYFDYDAVINPNPSPNDPSVSIANTDYVFGESNVAARLNVGIAGGRLTDTSDVNIQQSNKQQLEAISSASIILTIENGMPAQLQYTGKLYDGAGKFLLDLPPKHSPNPSAFTINAAKVNAQGNVIASTTDSITISLTGDEIQKFLESKKMVSSVIINTTSPGAEPVLFKTDQFIKMYGAGKLIYRVNK